jgi:hypothetical protein
MEDGHVLILKEVAHTGQTRIISNSSISPAQSVLYVQLAPSALLHHSYCTSYYDVSQGEGDQARGGVDLEGGVVLTEAVVLRNESSMINDKQSRTSSQQGKWKLSVRYHPRIDHLASFVLPVSHT